MKTKSMASKHYVSHGHICNLSEQVLFILKILSELHILESLAFWGELTNDLLRNFKNLITFHKFIPCKINSSLINFIIV